MSMPKHSTSSPIPSSHRRLAMEQVVDFGLWIDGQLAELETRFAEYITNHSAKLDSQRRRNSWPEGETQVDSSDGDTHHDED